MTWYRSRLVNLAMSLLSLGGLPAFAADGGASYPERFAKLEQLGSDVAVEDLAAAWRMAEPQNPQPYIALANYFWQRAQKVEISNIPPGPGDLTLEQDGRVVGSLGRGIDPELTNKAIASLTAAVDLFPSRVDLAFGLMFLYQSSDRFAEQAATLEKVLAYAAKHPKALFWADEAVSDPADTLASSAQGYLAFYLERGFEGDLEKTLQLAEILYRAYPDHLYPLHTIGVCHAHRGDWAKAKPFFEKALQLAPEDPLVLLNLGMLEDNLGNATKARQYFEKVLEVPATEDVLESARQRLDALSKPVS